MADFSPISCSSRSSRQPLSGLVAGCVALGSASVSGLYLDLRRRRRRRCSSTSSSRCSTRRTCDGDLGLLDPARRLPGRCCCCSPGRWAAGSPPSPKGACRAGWRRSVRAREGALSAGRRRPGREHVVAALRVRARRLQRPRRPGRVRAAAPARRAAAEPGRPGRRRRRFVVQHRHQLRHQHQLAGLRRRIDDELSDADARADGAELLLRRHRHRRGLGAGPRLRRALAAAPSATSGSTRRGRRSTCCCRSRSCSPSSWSARAWSRTSPRARARRRSRSTPGSSRRTGPTASR